MARTYGGLINRVSSLIAGAAQPWNPDPPYPSLFELRDYQRRLERIGGVYVVWHLGTCPRWLRVGASLDIAASLKAIADLVAVKSCRPNGGVFVAWSPAQQDQRGGIVQYLSQRLRPALQELVVAGESAAVDVPAIAISLPPGTQNLGPV